MRLIKLEIRQLYGTLDKTVEFNSEFNLLVGINGSGKTSVLNVVDWLVTPNLPRLAITQFSRLTLWFEHEDKEYILEAQQTNRVLRISALGMENQLTPLMIHLQEDPAQIDVENNLDESLARYSNLSPDAHEKFLWEFLKRIPKPIVIALDRTISAESGEEIYLDMDARFDLVTSRQRRAPSPLAKVKQVTTERYNRYQENYYELNERLKARIVMSALRPPNPDHMIGKATSKRRSKKEIEQLERKVTSYLAGAIKDFDVSAQVKRFFRGIDSLSGGSVNLNVRNHPLYSLMFSYQYQQIEDIAQAFNEFEQQSAAAFEELGNFLNVVNLFLKDSDKKIGFVEPRGVLQFQFLSESAIPQEPHRGIEHLSSGEKQILILLTFLAFVSKEHRVFIVDEPELSLHPKWQSEFIDAFMKLKPASTQLLIATHSPEIVGKHKQHCVVLLP